MILLVVSEEPDQIACDQSSVLDAYQNVICVSCLPAVRTLLLCLLTIKVYANDASYASSNSGSGVFKGVALGDAPKIFWRLNIVSKNA